jgi:hypothetical protein
MLSRSFWLEYEYIALTLIYCKTFIIRRPALSTHPLYLFPVQTFTMISMSRRFSLRIAVISAVITLSFCALFSGAQEQKSRKPRKTTVPPPSSRIEVSVIRDADGKPIEHAAVIFHPILGDKDNGIMELKTNEDGKAMVDVIPIGDTVRLQIIAKGFKTYGGDFEVNGPEISMEIRMKRPGGQYSIYSNGNTAKPNSGSADDNTKKPAEPEKPSEENKSKDQVAPPQQ